MTPDEHHDGLPVLTSVARRLQPLLGEVVFVGGQVSEIMITSPASTAIRPTFDVDLVVPVATKADYRVIERNLGELGLSNDMSEGAPLCRWRTPEGIAVDVMPTDPDVLGFSNRWYPAVVESAVEFDLTADLSIRIPPAHLYIATKWEAHDHRGSGDVLSSHDLEDIIAVVAGRPSIVDEIAVAPGDQRAWLAERAQEFLADELADYAIAGALHDARLIPGIVEDVSARIGAIARLG